MTRHDTQLLQRWAQTRDAEAFNEIVIRYADLVYGTCRRILRNETDAEDVTQECFLRLAQRPHQVRSSLGGWLHATATGRARDFLKAEARRRGRQERYVSERPVAGEASWDDIQGFVDEAIDHLPDQQRHIIVAHFLERQTHDAIALDLGVTRPTVSYHIQKGVENLREYLAGKGVKATATALLALLGTELAQATPPALAAKLGKLALAGTGGAGVAGARTGLLLSMKGVSAGAAALLMALLGWWWSMPPAPEPVSAQPAVAVAENLGDAAPPEPLLVDPDAPGIPGVPENAGTPPVATPAPAKAPDPGRATGAVAGVVVNEYGTPVPGALIYLQKRPEDESPFNEPVAATTAQDGSFRVDAVAANLPAIYADHPGYSPGWAAIHPGPDHIEQARILLKPGGIIEGRITVGGEPSPGSVSASLYSVIGTVAAGKDGTYRLERITPGTVDIVAFVTRHRNEIRTAIVEPGRTTVVDFDFPSVDAAIEGRVTLNGGPAPNAILRLTIETESGATESYSTSTGADGAYRFEAMPGGTAYMAAYATGTTIPNSRKSTSFKVAPSGVTKQDMDLTPGPCAVSGSVDFRCDDCRGAVSVLKGEVIVQEFTLSALAGLDSRSVAHTFLSGQTFLFTGLDPGTYTLMALSYPAGPNTETDVMGEALVDTVVVHIDAGEEAIAELHPEPVELADPAP